jgi:hypothetical protein
MSFNIQDQKLSEIQIHIASRPLFSILKSISNEKVKEIHQNERICFEQFKYAYNSHE